MIWCAVAVAAQTGLNQRISFASVHVVTNVHDTVNTGHIMNMKVPSGAALERALAAKLEELLRGVDWLRGWQVEHVGGMSDAGFDLLATVPLPGGGKAALCVECKGELRPSVFRRLADRSFSPARCRTISDQEGNPSSVRRPVLRWTQRTTGKAAGISSKPLNWPCRKGKDTKGLINHRLSQ